MARRMAYSKLSRKPMVIIDGRVISFYADPEQFIAMAGSVGLQVVRYSQHQYWENRYNYLFTKEETSDLAN
jgi:hypothetical protein